MRWTNRAYEIGDTRIVLRFFWLPRRFGDVWIWLEYGKVLQRRVESYTYLMRGCVVPHPVWKDESLITKTPRGL
jgi:hypothetical protein